MSSDDKVKQIERALAILDKEVAETNSISLKSAVAMKTHEQMLVIAYEGFRKRTREILNP